MQDANFDADCGSVGNSIDNTSLLNSNPRKSNLSGDVWPSPSLGNIMQCDRCLGAGSLPLPPSALSNLQQTSTDDSSCGTSVLADINLKPSLTDQTKNASKTVKIEDEESKASDPSYKELHKVFPDWTERICNAEKKWGIQHDNSQPYSERIEAIERKNLEYREVFHSSNASSQELDSEELPMSNDSFNKRYLKKVEDAERKWGLSSPEGFNIVERIELVEDAVSSYKRRLHRCL